MVGCRQDGVRLYRPAGGEAEGVSAASCTTLRHDIPGTDGSIWRPYADVNI